MSNFDDEEEKPKRRIRHPLEAPQEGDEDYVSSEEESQRPKQRVVFTMGVTQPYLTYALMAINIAIFAFSLFFREAYVPFYVAAALDPLAVLRDFQVHRLISVMFLHGDPTHIMFNMLALYSIGRRVELYYGRYRFLIVYFLGGMLGSVLSAIIGDYSIWSVGASGAIFALWASSFWFVQQNAKLFGENGRLILLSEGIFLIGNIFIGLDPSRNIDNLGHLGGFMGGLALAYFIVPRITFTQKIDAEGVQVITFTDNNPLDQKHTLMILAYSTGLLCLLVVGVLVFRAQSL